MTRLVLFTKSWGEGGGDTYKYGIEYIEDRRPFTLTSVDDEHNAERVHFL